MLPSKHFSVVMIIRFTCHKPSPCREIQEKTACECLCVAIVGPLFVIANECVWVRERERESNAFDVCATSVQSVCVCGCVVVVVCVCYTLRERERERSKDTLLTKCLLSKKSRAGHGTL